MKNYTKKEILPGVIHFHFKNQSDLCRAFIRLEEFYESPYFANKVFTLKEYKKWYVQTNGAWTYYSDWHGFNIPSWSITEFKKQFKKLRTIEKEIIAEFPSQGNYYVIAGCGDLSDPKDWEIVEHEIAHALFYLNPKYKEAMTVLVNKHKNLLIDLEAEILQNYNPSVLIDECQAYLSSSHDYVKEHTKISQDILDEFANLKKKFR